MDTIEIRGVKFDIRDSNTYGGYYLRTSRMPDCGDRLDQAVKLMLDWGAYDYLRKNEVRKDCYFPVVSLETLNELKAKLEPKLFKRWK